LEIITLNIEYFFEDGEWIASCNEVGLVGYQNKDLNEVKRLVREGNQLHTDGLPFQLIELIQPIQNRSAV
jgi:predicted RNase H-like HicB family nuclease